MTLKFGTDGIRGVANVELTPELALALGRSAADLFARSGRFLVGRDTRLSGTMLQSALSAGLSSSGAHVIDVGLLPTPGVAHLSAVRGAPAAMISASHNPFADNGIKFFLPGGRKLSDEIEDALEARLGEILGAPAEPSNRPFGSGIGVVGHDLEARIVYEGHLTEALSDQRLEGLKIVLDCANGAASIVAPEIFKALGAKVIVLFDEPDGCNINDACGSTHPEAMQRAVVENGADLGLAFDGDADRVLAADARGNMVDGDEIMGMLALDAKARGELVDDTLVLTVMSNLGLRLSMERSGVRVHETKVGDRYVLEALEANGWSLGGEQSGHIIFPAMSSTGDGVLTGLMVGGLVVRTGKPLAVLAAATMTRLPQVLRNVRVVDRDALDQAGELWREVRDVEAQLGHEGRVLLRASGTEPLIRVMVEATTQQRAEAACERLCGAVRRSLGSEEQA